MKTVGCAVLLVLLFSCAGFAALDVWVGPVGDWNEDAKWHDGGPTAWAAGNGSGEVKITPPGTDLTISDIQEWPAIDLKVASDNAIVRIVDGAELTVKRGYFGDGGLTGHGTVGSAIQTGGSFTIVDDFYIGNNGASEGNYTISGGSLCAYDKLEVGAGPNSSGTVGKITIIGSKPRISAKRFYVGAEGTGNYGTGTLEYQVGPDGVSAIGSWDEVNLDRAGANSTTNLIVSTTELSLPQEDIVLINQVSRDAVDGTFDTINGTIDAVEGAEIALGGNTYQLTYAYAAWPDMYNQNDVALVYTGGGAIAHDTTRAYDPSPLDDAIESYLSLSLLDWENPDPNNPGDSVNCDVYFGTEPNRLGAMDKVALGSDISQVDIDTTNFPNYGVLQNNSTYYWFVDVNDVGNVIEGYEWSFQTSENEPPVVEAGVNQTVWLGMSGTAGQELIQLDATVTDSAPYDILWTQVDNGASVVTIVTSDIEDPTITFTQRGVYEFKLSADDGIATVVSDTVQIVVGDDSCDASILDGGSYDTMDSNEDCIVDMTDLVELSMSWLNCTNVQEGCD